MEKEGFVLYKLFEPKDPEKPYAAEYYAKRAIHKYFKELLDLGNGYNGQITRLWFNKFIAEKQIFIEIIGLIREAKLEAYQELNFIPGSPYPVLLCSPHCNGCHSREVGTNTRHPEANG